VTYEIFIAVCYFSSAFAVALIACLWGSPKKMAGGLLLLSSVVASNLILAFNYGDFLSERMLLIIYAVIDLVLALIFIEFYRTHSKLLSHKWAAFLACVQIAMAGVNLAGFAWPAFAMGTRHVIMLNILMIIAFFACIAGFTPKNRREAVDILRAKLAYIRNDFLSRSIQRGLKTMTTGRSSGNAMDAHVGKKLRDLRISAGLNQTDVAELLGISQSQVNRFETGKGRASAAYLHALSIYYKVEMSYFFDGAEIGQEGHLPAAPKRG